MSAHVQTDGQPVNLEATFRFQAIGADWEIDTEQRLPEKVPRRICSVTEDFDHVWSRFRADSLVTRIAHAEGGGRFEFPARDLALFELYERLVAASDGVVDPLIGRDLELLGYDAPVFPRPRHCRAREPLSRPLTLRHLP
ncbi:FAD:protein FMN transferase [Rhodococcus opacus]|uniref:FAD:protein FMN transferase n=1 Tax=Rhodococcus opacus TaxID=37919 RepID=UPI001C437129|nr:FAD:protein FMN transferase [Rhodococcus opacus]MBV6760326.1 FAD:protein FMN transferase [Rhodococcus opacus]